MHLFYLPGFIPGEINELPEDESKHALKVLRLSSGDKIEVTDGKGTLYLAEVKDSGNKACRFKILSQTTSKPKDFYIHIAIAPTKNADRIEWFVEKCIEIGIDEISFIQCSRSERKNINLDRIEKIAVSAMKQSQTTSFPILNPLTSIKSFVENCKENDKFIGYLSEEHKELLQKAAPANSRYCILIGPEGDFTKDEVSLAFKNNFKPASLGNSRLRTETAGIAACHILNIINS
ncbi:MAG: 16S rRNA (uracil(1498)-N(3))-methyltransferase [Sporocytophaga sp.]|uniref:16S rRNA (uracil(1498)-N(3))-methyltransferase n=1 Tax=Sporocytophaga sp. TaxID=2231183 RepID=UPI001B2B602C|nr:16S rRNA (uracil(1498)-N(3))-methyltransferase [Sporocytophaga sp.]MBO9699126.1 16S rRNA (uracil(1498)-N(3))-methyltransferase [Sporocytophaga sp.]